MRVYSQTIHTFLFKAMKMARDIFNNETELKLPRNRFIYNNYYYPLSLVAFEGEKLGYFDPKHFQIGLNKDLATNTTDSVLKDILRHEIAHYITFAKYGEVIMPHGEEFKTICKSYKWSHAAKASLNIELANEMSGDIRSEKIIGKVKKLLSLGSSTNIHESEAAILKANNLLIKYNLSRAHLDTNQVYYTDTLAIQSKTSTKLSSIYELLKHFMLCPMLVYGKSQVSLEATGSKESIELAHYLFNVLSDELERLWQSYKFEHNIKGLKAKNSFFTGITRGYAHKMTSLESDMEPSKSAELMVVKDKMQRVMEGIYPNLRQSYSRRSMDTNSFNLGKTAGKSLNIKQGIKNTSKIFRLGNR